RAIDVGHAGSHRKNCARKRSHAACAVGAHRNRRYRAAPRRAMSARTTHAATALPALPAARAPVLFAALGLLFAILGGRSFYLQWVDNDFLQERGAARFSR